MKIKKFPISKIFRPSAEEYSCKIKLEKLEKLKEVTPHTG